MYSVRKKNWENIANVTKNATRFAPRNERERKKLKLTIGARTPATTLSRRGVCPLNASLAIGFSSRSGFYVGMCERQCPVIWEQFS